MTKCHSVSGSISRPVKALYNISKDSSFIQNPNPFEFASSTINSPFFIPNSSYSSSELDTRVTQSSSGLSFGIGNT